jgi:hypothetical protein
LEHKHESALFVQSIEITNGNAHQEVVPHRFDHFTETVKTLERWHWIVRVREVVSGSVKFAFDENEWADDGNNSDAV